MKKIVIFDLSENIGVEGGFKVSLIVKNAANGRLLVDEVQGKLPSMTESIELWQVWHQLYLKWGDRSDWGRIRPPQNEPTEKTIGVAFNTCQTAGDDLAVAFNTAINSSGCEAIRQTLTETIPRWQTHDLRKPPEITFILRTSNLTTERSLAIQRLPWHRWDFFNDRYPGAEIAFSTIALKTKVLKGKLKILVIFGDDRNIDITKDRQSLDRYLKSHPSIDYQSIDKPDRQTLKLKLKSTYHCIFFVGHSQSTPNPNLPVSPGKSHTKIWINDREYFSPLDDDFKPLFTSLVNRGLQLAFFNSCDGLTLARELTDLHINHSIVMKEVVSNLAAQAFIEYFLQEFSKGTPLHIALNKSRQHLRDRKDIYAPNASDIPTIVQNPYESQLVFKPNRLIVLVYRLMSLVRDFYRSIPTKKIFALLAICTFAFVITWKIMHPEPAFFSNINISIGDKLLPGANPGSSEDRKILERGAENFRNRDYAGAILDFTSYINTQKNVDIPPDIKIFIRNAEILKDWNRNNTPYLSIGTSVPIRTNLSVAREILRGVAQMQDEVSKDKGQIANRLLIAIANDDNNSTRSEEVAGEFVSKTSISGVVGHNATNASRAAQGKYKNKDNPLAMLSPTSFGDDIKGDYIYKMVTDMLVFANPTAQRIIKDAEGHRDYKTYICTDKDSYDNMMYSNEIRHILNGNNQEPIQDKELRQDNAEEICNFSFAKKLDSARKFKIIKQLVKGQANVLVASPFVDSIDKTLDLLVSIREKKELANLKIYGSPTLYTHKTLNLERTKNKLIGLTIPDPWHHTAKTDSFFIREYKELWKEDQPNNWRTAMAYAATRVIYLGLRSVPDRLENLSQVKCTEVRDICIRQSLNKQLKSIERFDMNGAIPDLRFVQNQDSDNSSTIKYVNGTPTVSFIQLDRDNKFVRLK